MKKINNSWIASNIHTCNVHVALYIILKSCAHDMYMYICMYMDVHMHMYMYIINLQRSSSNIGSPSYPELGCSTREKKREINF